MNELGVEELYAILVNVLSITGPVGVTQKDFILNEGLVLGAKDGDLVKDEMIFFVETRKD